MSLASATSSRIDSASKHIQPCRVHQEYMVHLLKGQVENAQMELTGNKMKYCMHKDEVVIGLGKGVSGESLLYSNKRAYPPVITNLARIQDGAKNWLLLHFTARSTTEIDQLKEKATTALRATGDKKHEYAIDQIKQSLNMYFVGISLGMAYAHEYSGDTVASVLIGGLKTVMNGHFQVYTNDLLMFYIDGEEKFFNKDGSRRPVVNLDGAGGPNGKTLLADYITTGSTESLNRMLHAPQGPDARGEVVGGKRKAYYEMGNGNFSKDNPQKIHIFRIKPWRPTYPGVDPVTKVLGDEIVYPLDKQRIFGRAISNAQPHELLDIQLSRQSI